MHFNQTTARNNFEPPFDRAKHRTEVKDTPTEKAIPVPVEYDGAPSIEKSC